MFVHTHTHFAADRELSEEAAPSITMLVVVIVGSNYIYDLTHCLDVRNNLNTFSTAES